MLCAGIGSRAGDRKRSRGGVGGGHRLSTWRGKIVRGEKGEYPVFPALPCCCCCCSPPPLPPPSLSLSLFLLTHLFLWLCSEEGHLPLPDDSAFQLRGAHSPHSMSLLPLQCPAVLSSALQLLHLQPTRLVLDASPARVLSRLEFSLSGELLFLSTHLPAF